MALRTPSTYAVLGLLATRSWGAHELVVHLRRSTIRFVWPRTASKLYEEPKRLVARGFARTVGDGRRPVYEITDEGRGALGAWLGEPTGPPIVEAEALLKVLFAQAGTRDQLLATIRGLRSEADRTMREVAEPVTEQWVTSGPSMPERAHLSALVADFVTSLSDTVIAWCDRAEATVDSWPDLASDPDRLDFAIDFAKAWRREHVAG